jgi:hypothetical protein
VVIQGDILANKQSKKNEEVLKNTPIHVFRNPRRWILTNVPCQYQLAAFEKAGINQVVLTGAGGGS